MVMSSPKIIEVGLKDPLRERILSPPDVNAEKDGIVVVGLMSTIDDANPEEVDNEGVEDDNGGGVDGDEEGDDVVDVTGCLWGDVPVSN